MSKKIASVIMAVFLCFMVSVPAFAQSSNLSVKEEIADFSIPVSNSVEGIVFVPLYTSAEGTITNPATRALNLITTGIARNGNSESCQIFLNWKGVDMYSSWKFSSCTVDNAGFLFWNETYGTIDGATKEVTASVMGAVSLGFVNIPTDVTEARVNLSGLQGYHTVQGSWLSAVIAGKLGKIN